MNMNEGYVIQLNKEGFSSKEIMVFTIIANSLLKGEWNNTPTSIYKKCKEGIDIVDIVDILAKLTKNDCMVLKDDKYIISDRFVDKFFNIESKTDANLKAINIIESIKNKVQNTQDILKNNKAKKDKKPNAYTVKVILQEKMKRKWGDKYILTWSAKEASLAKKMIDEFGWEMVEKLVSVFVERWEEISFNDAVPCFAILYSIRAKLYSFVKNGSIVKNKDKAEYRENNEDGITF